MALKALSGELTLAELASKCDVHPTQTAGWKRQVKESMVAAFFGKVASAQIRDKASIWTAFGGQGDGLGQFRNPAGVAVDGSGRLYVADSVNNRIQLRDAAGDWSILGEMGTDIGQFAYPIAVVLDGSGKLYVADAFNNRIQVRDKAGNWTIYGGGATGTAPGKEDGQFFAPQGLTVSKTGMLYVADSDNNRIEAARIANPPIAPAASLLLLN